MLDLFENRARDDPSDSDSHGALQPVLEIRKDGSIAGWCKDIRDLIGRCPEGFDRDCEDCFCG